MIGKTTLAILAIAVSTFALAQEHCTSRTITERWLQVHGQHIDLAQEAAQLEQQGVRGGGVRTIPVVVHVVWNTNAENVSNATVLAIINQMNLDYQALNSDYGNVRSQFAASRANAQIDFCLATTDPNGNATTGITRFQSTEIWFDPDTETNDMKFSPKGTPAWNTTQYLNIWICDITSGATGGLVTAGYAYLPYGGMAGSLIDGLVLDYSYGTSAGDRTATHEVGHYLGLDHPWGDGNCSPGDGISDTPATNTPTFSCSNTSLMKCSTLTQYENFMDYSNCTMMFTNGQAAVMTGVLNGSRSALMNSTACSNSNSGLCIPTSVTGTNDGDFIDGVILGTINNVGSGSMGGPAYTYYSGSSTSLSRGGSYTIEVTNGEYFEDLVAAWIDFNGNGQLEADEMLGDTLTTSPFQVTPFTFTVPMDAVLGNTILRVRDMYPNTGEPDTSDPCANFSWGETEDYNVNITVNTAVREVSMEAVFLRNFQDRILVSWPRPAKDQHVVIMDASGRIVQELAPTGTQFSIPTSSMAAGIYQLVLTLDGKPLVAKFAVVTQ